MAFGLIPFSVGLVLAVLFVALRLWEVRRGSRFFESFRRALDRRAVALYRTLVFGEMPRRWRESLARFGNRVLHRSVRALVAGLRAIERPLSRMSHRMRTNAQSGTREPSEFLKTITPKRIDGKDDKNSV